LSSLENHGALAEQGLELGQAGELLDLLIAIGVIIATKV